MLGHTFASLRGDRVVALDGNPDAGSLGYRVRKETVATVTNLLADEREIVRYADIPHGREPEAAQVHIP
jgi:putative peptide zinc metalloprotease protein